MLIIHEWGERIVDKRHKELLAIFYFLLHKRIVFFPHFLPPPPICMHLSNFRLRQCYTLWAWEKAARRESISESAAQAIASFSPHSHTCYMEKWRTISVWWLDTVECTPINIYTRICAWVCVCLCGGKLIALNCEEQIQMCEGNFHPFWKKTVKKVFFLSSICKFNIPHSPKEDSDFSLVKLALVNQFEVKGKNQNFNSSYYFQNLFSQKLKLQKTDLF